jgi:hypothetical protein
MTIIAGVVSNAFTATRLLMTGESLAVRLTNTGVFAMGFMMEKKPMSTDRA